MKNRLIAFTLAEVLITLAIIGVVAAITIPTLITKMNDRVRTNQIKVAEKRLVQGLNLFNTLENGLSGKKYESTYEFLQGLSKHFKMTAICDSNELSKCWPYENINFQNSDGSTGSVAVSSLKTPASFNLENDKYYAPAAFVTASGIPYLVMLEKDYEIQDTDKPMSKIPEVIKGLYDISGAKSPNRFQANADVLAINGASLKMGPDCVAEIGGLCMKTTPFVPDGLTLEQCQEEKAKNYGITQCEDLSGDGGDRWAAAMKTCHDQGLHLPSQDDLAKIATEIYGRPVSGDEYLEFETSQSDKLLAAINKYGFLDLWDNGRHSFALWSSVEDGSDAAYTRYFYSEASGWDYNDRDDEYTQAVCLGD